MKGEEKRKKKKKKKKEKRNKSERRGKEKDDCNQTFSLNNEKEEVRVFNVWSCLWLVSCDTLALQWLAVASSLTHLGRKEISDLPTTYYYLPRYWRALYLVRRTTSIIHIHIYIQHTHTPATHLNTANYLCFDGDLGFVLLISPSVRFFYFILFILSFSLFPFFFILTLLSFTAVLRTPP